MDPTAVSDNPPPDAEDFVHVPAEISIQDSNPNPNRSPRSESSHSSSSEDSAYAELDSTAESETLEAGAEADRGIPLGGGRRLLPEELSRGVLHLECESNDEICTCDVYLVGTAHVSQGSDLGVLFYNPKKS